MRPIRPSEEILPADAPQKWFVAQAYYLWFGRNAWYSTEIRRYYEDSIAFNRFVLEVHAERRRKQGSTFRISSIPILSFYYDDKVFGICPINGRDEKSYSSIINNIETYRKFDFYKSLPVPESGWLFIFDITDHFQSIREGYSPENFKSFTRGRSEFLGWKADFAAQKYEKFAQFSAFLSAHLNSLRKE